MSGLRHASKTLYIKAKRIALIPAKEKNSAQKSLNDLPEEIVLFLASFLNVGDLVNKYFTLNEQEWSL